MEPRNLEEMSKDSKLPSSEDDCSLLHVKRCLSCGMSYYEREKCPEGNCGLCLYDTDETPYYD